MIKLNSGRAVCAGGALYPSTAEPGQEGYVVLTSVWARFSLKGDEFDCLNDLLITLCCVIGTTILLPANLSDPSQIGV